MSSSKKKLAIINSQNTTKTLKFAERPLPVSKKVNEKSYIKKQGKLLKRDLTNKSSVTVSQQQNEADCDNRVVDGYVLASGDISPNYQSSISLKYDNDDPLAHEDDTCTCTCTSSFVEESLPSRSTTAFSNTKLTNLTNLSINQASSSPSPITISPIQLSSSLSLNNNQYNVCEPPSSQSDLKTLSGNSLVTTSSVNMLSSQPLAASDPAAINPVNYSPPPSTTAPSSNGNQSPAVLQSSVTQFNNESQKTTYTCANQPTSLIDNQGLNSDPSVAEFLAFSNRPVSLSDFLIGGEKVSLKEKHPIYTKNKPKLLPLTNAKSPTFTTLPHTVHQFCVHTDLPLLPLQIQILSRKVHAHPPSREWLTQNQPKESHHKDPTPKHGDGLELLGVTLPIESDPMKLIWAPSPGKLSLYPSTVQRLLTTQRDIINDTELYEDKEEESVTIEIEEDEHLQDIKQLQQRVLYESSNNTNPEAVVTENGEETDEMNNEQDEEKALDNKTTTIDSHSQYQFIMNEITWQREQLLNLHKEIFEASKKSVHEEGETDDDTISGGLGSQLGSNSTFNSTRNIMRRTMRGTTKKGNLSTTAQRHRPLKRTNSAIARSQYLRQEVSKPSRTLKRSISYPSMTFEIPSTNDDQKKIDYNPTNIKLRRFNSDPHMICYDELIIAKGITSDPRQAADSIWDEWFYEVLAEVRAAIAELDKGRQPYVKWEPSINKPDTDIQVQTRRKTGTLLRTRMLVKTEPPSPMGEIELANIPHLVGIDPQVCNERLKEINNEIESTEDSQTKATLLYERGSLNRKIGRLSDSMADLTEALSVYPRLSSPHWEKHLLYLIQGKTKSATGDLTLLLKKDSNHVLGYQSRGALHAQMGRLDDAIQNYTRAIWLDSGNAKLHFIRAELKEKRGEIEAAVGDYSTVVSLDPLNEEALMRQATHKYNRKLWGNTTQLLSSLLSINQNRMEAWLLRSQAYLKMDKYDLALKDLSAAIHLNPNNSTLYYQRGCLLRSQDPVRSLKDFSITLLLSELNSNAAALTYLYRGVVYTQLKCMDEALGDFMMAIKLDNSLSSAHTNAGLMIMNHIRKPSKAIKFFTAGMLADPTYIRALLCRAEAYTKLGEYDKAILDWTRAIHYSPDNPSYHLNQGKIFLKMKDYSNALLCIRTSSNLGGSIGSSPAQQALVYAFLGDHNKAISRLQAVVKDRRSINLYTVLGKVQLRARMFEDAANSFNSAIEYINFTDPYLSSVTNKTALTNLHYMNGKSLLGARNFKKAAEQFSHVFSIDHSNAWAYYYHGLALLKHGSTKGMISINHALMLKPELTEGYLTRAAYYGKVCRFSKAILNCTEAIRLQPKSSRAYLYRGVLRHKMGYDTSAIADLSMAIAISPALSSVALFNRGICYQATGDTEKALRDYSTMCLMEGTHLYQVFVNRGLLYLDINDYRNAALDFAQASEIQSEDSKIWQTIGFCHHQLGDLHNAVQSYSKAIELNPLFYEAYIGRGNAYAEFLTEQGNDRARSDYHHVIENNSKCLAAQLNLALLHQCEGKHMLAWENITELLENYKDYVPALEARAIISLQNMNTFGSLLDINRAIQLQPSANLYVERGVIYQYMKDVYNAVKDFDKALSMDPSLAIAHYNMGNVLLQQKLYIQAIERYSRVIDLVDKEKSDEALVNRGICHVAIGDYTKAITDFDSSIKANPFAAHGYFNRANLLKKSGNLSAAEQDYRKALSLYPNDPVSLDYHGYTLSLLGNAEESRKQYMKCVEEESVAHIM